MSSVKEYSWLWTVQMMQFESLMNDASKDARQDSNQKEKRGIIVRGIRAVAGNAFRTQLRVAIAHIEQKKYPEAVTALQGNQSNKDVKEVFVWLKKQK